MLNSRCHSQSIKISNSRNTTQAQRGFCLLLQRSLCGIALPDRSDAVFDHEENSFLGSKAKLSSTRSDRNVLMFGFHTIYDTASSFTEVVTSPQGFRHVLFMQCSLDVCNLKGGEQVIRIIPVTPLQSEGFLIRANTTTSTEAITVFSRALDQRNHINI